MLGKAQISWTRGDAFAERGHVAQSQAGTFSAGCCLAVLLVA